MDPLMLISRVFRAGVFRSTVAVSFDFVKSGHLLAHTFFFASPSMSVPGIYFC